MKSKATMTVAVLTISILSMALFSFNSEIPQAFAKKCEPMPDCKKGGSEDPPTDPPSSKSAKIELIDCDNNGRPDKWPDGDITYFVSNNSNEKQATIDAVIAGVEQWNNIIGKNDPDSPYLLKSVGTVEDAQITVNVFKKITPGYILGFAEVCSDDVSNIGVHVSISVGIKGLSADGVKNLVAHEVGHGLGLGHTLDNNSDLMASSLDAKERKNLICPSNLNVEALSADESPYMVNEWEILNC